MTRRLPFACFLFLVLPLLLSACGPVTSATPETLVLSKLINTRSKVNPFTIDILQKQTLKDHVFILVEYQATRAKGDIVDCQSFYDIFQNNARAWSTFGGDLSCFPHNPLDPKPSWTGGGFGATFAEPNGGFYSYIYGRTPNDDITIITAHWEDGVNQTVSLNKNVFLAMREGKIHYLQITGKDKTGKVIYTQTFGP